MKMPNIGETWQHYKGGNYIIQGFAWDAVGEELRLLVLYGADGGPVFSRTIDNFLMPVAIKGCARFAPEELPF